MGTCDKLLHLLINEDHGYLHRFMSLNLNLQLCILVSWHWKQVRDDRFNVIKLCHRLGRLRKNTLSGFVPCGKRNTTLAKITLQFGNRDTVPHEQDYTFAREIEAILDGYLYINQPQWSLDILNLLKRQSFIILEADKSLGLCIISKLFYRSLCCNFLKSDDFRRAHVHISHTIHFMSEIIQGCLDYVRPMITSLPFSVRYLIGFLDCLEVSQCKIPVFQGLIKIHKDPIAIRPILSCWGCPIGIISGILHLLLGPLVLLIPGCVHLPDKVGPEAFDAVKKLGNTGSYLWFISWDFSSIFTKLKHKDIMDAIRFWTEAAQWSSEMTELVLFLTQEVLKWRYFVHNGDIYIQVNGIFMGLSAATDICNLVLGMIEIGSKACLPGRIVFYNRYVDDVFSIIATTTSDAPDFEVDVLIWKYSAKMQPIDRQTDFLDYRFKLTHDTLESSWKLTYSHRFKDSKLPCWPTLASPHPQEWRSSVITAQIFRRSVDLDSAKESIDTIKHWMCWLGYNNDSFCHYLEKVKRKHAEWLAHRGELTTTSVETNNLLCITVPLRIQLDGDTRHGIQALCCSFFPGIKLHMVRSFRS